MFHNSSSLPSSYYNNDPLFSNSLSSSLPSDNYFMHRSGSTHSLTHDHLDIRGGLPNPTSNPFFLSSSPPSNCEVFDFHPEPVRRVFSTGDLQASTENFAQEGVAIGGRVGKYSAEERMKRIERYRSKRNQRNFHKKITYACRKTLADSRPRVRGRFARNGETDAETEPEVEAEASENKYVTYNNHNTHEYCGSYTSYNNSNGGDNNGEWYWRQMQAALLMDEGDEECGYDDDLWASLDSVFSMNLLS